MTNATGIRFTERLRLEPIASRHADELWRIHQDDRVAEWYSLSHEQAVEMAATMERQWAAVGVGTWIAYHRETGALIGRGGLSREEIQARDELEIGRAGLAFAFEALDAASVVAFTEVHNTASRAMMARLGMEYEGEIRQPELIAGFSVVQDDAPFAFYRIRHPGLSHECR